jgi:hypothetical protein
MQAVQVIRCRVRVCAVSSCLRAASVHAAASCACMQLLFAPVHACSVPASASVASSAQLCMCVRVRCDGVRAPCAASSCVRAASACVCVTCACRVVLRACSVCACEACMCAALFFCVCACRCGRGEKCQWTMCMESILGNLPVTGIRRWLGHRTGVSGATGQSGVFWGRVV